MMRHRNKIIIGGIVLLVLAVAFFWGGDFAAKDNNRDKAPETLSSAQLSETGDSAGEGAASADAASGAQAIDATEGAASEAAGETSNEFETLPDAVGANTTSDTSDATPAAGTAGTAATDSAATPAPATTASDESPENPTSQEGLYHTDPTPAGKPAPVEPEAAQITETALTCTLSVVCDKILDNMDLLPEEKAGLIPADGIILPATQVTFYEGESVFNVLLREMKKNKIHLEYVSTPIYNSAYIEGLNNIYEFDCGELSGWMFSVNGWFPNYGPSRYQLQAGDTIVWTFSCDLGRDVGSDYSAAEQR